jgi:acetyl-CoA/propionyl-CoA carboxylase biotin carboxyl carrier protein
MFDRILIANRGEIAVRVTRTCHDLGVEVVAVHSDVDAKARHVALADQAVHLLGVTPTETYLNLDAVVQAAVDTGAEAVHPGYGFLSERADAAEAVVAAGLVWIGPPPDALRATGDKVRARRLAESAGVNGVPGTLDPISSVDEVVAFGQEHGWPVAIKASGGGGGRGLKVAAGPDEVADALDSAVREARAYFGSDEVYLERYLGRPKHVEVQVLAPAPGRTMWLGARECSLQRRHQKLVEETPPAAFLELVPEMGSAAARVADACGYLNAGTVEFLVDPNAARFYFLEVNARLQVEHTITEAVTGVDLVAAQLRIASGEEVGFGQDDLEPGAAHAPRGHAIECRINAEDPSRGFLPTPGRITRYREPGGPGVRVDSGFGEGDEVPGAYDSLVAKLVVWGATRAEARRRTLRALDEFEIQGIRTTIPAHRVLLELPEFVDGTYSTRTVEEGALDELARTGGDSQGQPTADGQAAVVLVAGSPARLWNPAIAASVSGGSRGIGGASAGSVVAPMHGTVIKVLVADGGEVQAGEPVAVLETMKMETHVSAGMAGTVRAVHVQPGSVVEAGQLVATIE